MTHFASQFRVDLRIAAAVGPLESVFVATILPDSTQWPELHLVLYKIYQLVDV
jgi:hypothetical protein